MSKQVAITGATGFIGRKLAMLHLDRGYKVRVLSRRSSSEAGFPDSVHWFQGDLISIAELQAFVDGVDVLYHCAGQLKDTSKMRMLHVDATRKLVEAASGRIGRWVQLSSVGVYGPVNKGIVTEGSVLKPCGEYETTKADSDQIVTDSADKGSFNYSILRPSNVYGAGMTNRSLYSLIAMIQRGLFFFIGNPGASANYIHVANVAEALLLCGEMPQAVGQVYNLSDYRMMEQFIGVIAQSLGKKIPHARVPEHVIRFPAKLLGNLPGIPLTETRVDALTGHAIYSNEKIERELGYRHSVSMEDGLKELVEFWRETTGK